MAYVLFPNYTNNPIYDNVHFFAISSGNVTIFLAHAAIQKPLVNSPKSITYYIKFKIEFENAFL